MSEESAELPKQQSMKVYYRAEFSKKLHRVDAVAHTPKQAIEAVADLLIEEKVGLGSPLIVLLQGDKK